MLARLEGLSILASTGIKHSRSSENRALVQLEWQTPRGFMVVEK